VRNANHEAPHYAFLLHPSVTWPGVSPSHIMCCLLPAYDFVWDDMFLQAVF